MLRPSSSDPAAEAYYAASRAMVDITHEDGEWNNERMARQAKARAALHEAAAVLKAAADPGNPEIWHAVAHAERYPGKDEDAAILWERKAADAGLPAAMVSLALLLQRQDHHSPEAIEWLNQAASLGSASAMVFLGFAFRDGHGVSMDFQAAADWFRKAVTAGDSHSLVNVGKVHAFELRDEAGSLSWFLRAAEAGHRDAFIYLADLYGDRSSPVHNPGEALLWYHRVAETGGHGSAARAMLELSDRYRDGIGTGADRAKAREWLVKHIEHLPANSRRIQSAKDALRKFDASLC